MVTGRGLVYRIARFRFQNVETLGSLRFLGNPCKHAMSYDPGSATQPQSNKLCDAAFGVTHHLGPNE